MDPNLTSSHDKAGDRDSDLRLTMTDAPPTLRGQDRTTPGNMNVSRKDVESALDSAEDLNYSNKEAVQSFRVKYGDMFLPGTKILLRLAERVDWPADKIKAFLQSVIGDYRDLLLDGEDSIHAALLNENNSFIQAVLDTGDSGALESVLSKRGKDFPAAIQEAIICQSPMTSEMIRACAANRAFFVDDDADGHNTPLHLAIDSFDANIQKQTSGRVKPSKTQTLAIGKITDGFRLRLAERFSSYDVVRQLIHVEPKALELPNVNRDTPYQLRVNRLYNLDGKPSRGSKHGVTRPALRTLVRRDLVASYIVQHCVRNMPRQRAVAALYKPGEGRNSP